MHWPVHDCLMVDPGECESRRTLDHFVSVMLQIAQEIDRDPALLKAAPTGAPIARADEVAAARKPVLVWED